MQFNLETYHPIDYRLWIVGDEAREGINIQPLLTSTERGLFREAVPFQDQRGDPGQGEMVTYFAIMQLNYLNGNRDIVVPAAILHDTGWYNCDVDSWKKLVSSGGDTENEAVRRPHQNRSLMIAGMLFERVKVNIAVFDLNAEIADIVGDHDTRKLPTTSNGRIMWDADMLWRVTHPCAQAYFPNVSAQEALDRMEKTGLAMSKPHDLSEIAQQIGRVEITNTMMWRYGKHSIDLLKGKYVGELDKILSFYSD